MHKTSTIIPPPDLLSFDVFGTLIDTRFGTYSAYRSILDDAGGREMEMRPFWSFWQERVVARYVEPYKSYKEICRLAFEESLIKFGLARILCAVPTLSGRGKGTGLSRPPSSACGRIQH